MDGSTIDGLRESPLSEHDFLGEAFPGGMVHSFPHGDHCFGLVAFPPIVLRWIPTVPERERRVDEGTVEAARTLASQVASLNTVPPQPQVPSSQTSMTINLSLSHSCTLDCAYCYRPKSPGTRDGRMDVGIARRAIDFAFESPLFGGRELCFGFSQTCEPLLHLQEIRDLRDYVRQKAENEGRLAVPGRALLSNGTLLTSEMLADPLFAGNRFYLSMDGPLEIHDSVRKYQDGTGSYSHVRAASELLLDRGLVIGVAAVLTGRDPRVLDIFLHHRQLGFGLIGIKPVRLPHDHPLSINESNIEGVLNEYTRFVEYLMSLPDEPFLDCTLRLSPSDFFRRFVDRLVRRSVITYRCPAVRGEISIDTDGRIYPCGSFTGKSEWCIGSIENGVDEKRFAAFHSEAHVDNRVGCRCCWARYLCGGGCYYNSAIVNGSMFSPDEVKCRLVKHIIELAMVFTGHLHDRGESVLSLLGYREQNGAHHYDCHYSGMPASVSQSPPAEVQAMNLDEGSMIRRKAWRGPTDLSAEIRIWWNERGLNLVADVTDDIFFQPFDMTWFNAGDCIRLALQNPETGNLHEFGAALLSAGPGIFRTINGGLAKPVESAYVDIGRVGNKTRYGVTLPWHEMDGAPSPGDTWPFSLVVMDNDRTSSGWMQWAPGLMPQVNSQAMGKIAFVP